MALSVGNALVVPSFWDMGAGWGWEISDDMKKVRVVVYYSGRVQGVGFRYTVKSLVSGFEVGGEVRNLNDGRVELVAEGEDGELRAFLRAIRDSGLGGHIRDEQINWCEATGEFRGFDITG